MASIYMLTCAHVREKHTPTHSPTSQPWHLPSTCSSGGAPLACYKSPCSLLIDPSTHYLVSLDFRCCLLLFIVVVVNAYVLYSSPFTRYRFTSHRTTRAGLKDGKVGAKRYFRCGTGHAVFVPWIQLRPGPYNTHHGPPLPEGPPPERLEDADSVAYQEHVRKMGD